MFFLFAFSIRSWIQFSLRRTTVLLSVFSFSSLQPSLSLNHFVLLSAQSRTAGLSSGQSLNSSNLQVIQCLFFFFFFGVLPFALATNLDKLAFPSQTLQSESISNHWWRWPSRPFEWKWSSHCISSHSPSGRKLRAEKQGKKLLLGTRLDYQTNPCFTTLLWLPLFFCN